jgi:hypothetical protein
MRGNWGLVSLLRKKGTTVRNDGMTGKLNGKIAARQTRLSEIVVLREQICFLWAPKDNGTRTRTASTTRIVIK